MLASGPSVMYGATTTAPGPAATVYYYQDPRTGQRVASLLPPDHPQMVCLQAGEHVPETRYGFLGALCFHVLLSFDCVWAHVSVFCIDRRYCGDCVVPYWHRSVSARSPCPMQALRRVDRGRALQLIGPHGCFLLPALCSPRYTDGPVLKCCFLAYKTLHSFVYSMMIYVHYHAHLHMDIRGITIGSPFLIITSFYIPRPPRVMRSVFLAARIASSRTGLQYPRAQLNTRHINVSPSGGGFAA